MMKKLSRLSKLTRLSVDEFVMLDKLIANASRKDLDEIQERVEREIHLSDVAISEGYEKDDRKLKKVI